MKVVCAWCLAELRPGSGADGEDVSHGICAACKRFFFDEEGGETTLGAFLDGLPVPVAVLGPGGRVQAANPAARALGAAAADGEEPLYTGDLIACANASRPEGCGRTRSCLGCVLRETAGATFADGEPRETVTEAKALGDGRRARFRIATRRHRGAVLLRIDEVREADPD